MEKKEPFFLKEQNNTTINNNIDEIMNKIHKKDFQTQTHSLIKGLIDLLNFLDNEGIKMHIATGSSERIRSRNITKI